MLIRYRLDAYNGPAFFSGGEEPFNGKTEQVKGSGFLSVRMPRTIGIAGAGFGTHNGTAEITGKTQMLLKAAKHGMPFIRIRMYRVDITAEHRNGDMTGFKGPADFPGVAGAESAGTRGRGECLG